MFSNWAKLCVSPLSLNLDKQTAKGSTALHYCCLTDNSECLKLLLRGKASIDIGMQMKSPDVLPVETGSLGVTCWRDLFHDVFKDSQASCFVWWRFSGCCAHTVFLS